MAPATRMTRANWTRNSPERQIRRGWRRAGGLSPDLFVSVAPGLPSLAIWSAASAPTIAQRSADGPPEATARLHLLSRPSRKASQTPPAAQAQDPARASNSMPFNPRETPPKLASATNPTPPIAAIHSASVALAFCGPSMQRARSACRWASLIPELLFLFLSSTIDISSPPFLARFRASSPGPASLAAQNGRASNISENARGPGVFRLSAVAVSDFRRQNERAAACLPALGPRRAAFAPAQSPFHRPRNLARGHGPSR
jgi:hypothetical protein